MCCDENFDVNCNFYDLKTLLRIAPGSNKWMVYAFLLIGFIYSIVNGVKEKLQKLKKIGSFE